MPKNNFGAGITGLGRCLPKNKVSNETLARGLGVSSQWIHQRSGIEARHFVSAKEPASKISVMSSRQALRRARVKAGDIDLIIGCTTSGDYLFPALAAKVQHLLGAKKAGAFDLSASASSFAIALGLARDRIANDPSVKHVLVFGTAVQSPYIDWKNPSLAAILGDGSAAAVISKVPKNYGILSSEVLCRGENFDAARLRAGGSSHPFCPGHAGLKYQSIEMDGVKMGREFIKTQPRMIAKALRKAKLRIGEVDLFIFHQANLRLIQMLMQRLKLPMSKTYTSFEQAGNTAEASVPFALCEAWEKGLIRKGSLVVVSAIGAGCILATTVLRWS